MNRLVRWTFYTVLCLLWVGNVSSAAEQAKASSAVEPVKTQSTVEPAKAQAVQVPQKTQEQVKKREAYGSALMTADERAEYRKTIHSFKTEQERVAFRAEHHLKMHERARSLGKRLPGMPRLDSANHARMFEEMHTQMHTKMYAKMHGGTACEGSCMHAASGVAGGGCCMPMNKAACGSEPAKAADGAGEQSH